MSHTRVNYCHAFDGQAWKKGASSWEFFWHGKEVLSYFLNDLLF